MSCFTEMNNTLDATAPIRSKYSFLIINYADYLPFIFFFSILRRVIG